MWLTDDYEGNGNAGGNSDGYEGGWEGTSAAYEAAMTLQAKRELCWTEDVTLDGEPAMIAGARNAFATVETLRCDGPAVEFAWSTVARIVANGAAFKS